MNFHSKVRTATMDGMTILMAILGVLAVGGISAALVETGRDGYGRRHRAH